jgi:hypothetical protein
MPTIPPTRNRNRPNLESVIPNPAMSDIECQWRPEPTLPNVDNGNTAMSDFKTAEWVKRGVIGQLLALIGMPPAVGRLQPAPSRTMLVWARHL